MTVRSDLADYYGNPKDGIPTVTMAEAWMYVVWGEVNSFWFVFDGSDRRFQERAEQR